MKRGMKGKMNIDFTETYNQEDDIYYVTFKTGEPSYCVEINDVLLLEVGVFTSLPTGFRILNFHKQNVKAVRIALLKRVKEALEGYTQEVPSFQEREARVEQALEKVLA